MGTSHEPTIPNEPKFFQSKMMHQRYRQTAFSHFAQLWKRYATIGVLAALSTCVVLFVSFQSIRRRLDEDSEVVSEDTVPKREQDTWDHHLGNLKRVLPVLDSHLLEITIPEAATVMATVRAGIKFLEDKEMSSFYKTYRT